MKISYEYIEYYTYIILDLSHTLCECDEVFSLFFGLVS